MTAPKGRLARGGLSLSRENDPVRRGAALLLALALVAGCTAPGQRPGSEPTTEADIALSGPVEAALWHPLSGQSGTALADWQGDAQGQVAFELIPTAVPEPYAGGWLDVRSAVEEILTAVALRRQTPADAPRTAAAKANRILRAGS